MEKLILVSIAAMHEKATSLSLLWFASWPCFIYNQWMTTRSRQWKKRLILVRNISSSIVKTAWVSVAKWAHDLLYWSSRWRQNEKSEKALFEADWLPQLMNSSTKDSLKVVTIQPLLVYFNEFDNKIKRMSGLIQSCCKILKSKIRQNIPILSNSSFSRTLEKIYESQN